MHPKLIALLTGVAALVIGSAFLAGETKTEAITPVGGASTVCAESFCVVTVNVGYDIPISYALYLAQGATPQHRAIFAQNGAAVWLGDTDCDTAWFFSDAFITITSPLSYLNLNAVVADDIRVATWQC